MPPAVLIGLIIFGVAVVAGLAAAALTGLQAWRDFRAFRRVVLGRLGELGDELAKLEQWGTGAAGGAARIDHARERLQRTFEAAAVVTGAARESWSLFKLARGVVPRK